jgi:hypothetical protein
MILTLAGIWVILTLVNFVQGIIARTVSILERQNEAWYQIYDSFMLKVYRPSMMLVEVIFLSLIVFKIA